MPPELDTMVILFGGVFDNDVKLITTPQQFRKKCIQVAAILHIDKSLISKHMEIALLIGVGSGNCLRDMCYLWQGIMIENRQRQLHGLPEILLPIHDKCASMFIHDNGLSDFQCWLMFSFGKSRRQLMSLCNIFEWPKNGDNGINQQHIDKEINQMNGKIEMKNIVKQLIEFYQTDQYLSV
eukprot:352542_1